MEVLTPLVLVAFGSLVVVALLLLLVDIDISQTRRIEKQVARDVRRIRTKTINGWSLERIAKRYPHIPAEQIHSVRRAMARRMAAAEEVDRLNSMWSIEIPEPDYEL